MTQEKSDEKHLTYLFLLAMNLGCFHLRQGTSDYLEACSKDNDVSSEETHPPSINQLIVKEFLHIPTACSKILGIP